MLQISFHLCMILRMIYLNYLLYPRLKLHLYTLLLFIPITLCLINV